MNFDNHKAIYLQIADYVIEQILLKEWLENEKIPSVREFAISIEVNPNTVVRAYTHLEEKAFIVMQRGIGYFVATGAVMKVIELKKQEFLSQHLPQMFKSMELLNIDIDQIVQQYHKRMK